MTRTPTKHPYTFEDYLAHDHSENRYESFISLEKAIVTTKKAGRNVRRMALERRSKSLRNYAGSVLLLVITPPIYFLLGQSGLAILACLTCAVGAFVLIGIGNKYWKRADRADQGAKGEEEVENVLSPLEQEGWRIEYNLDLGRTHGDADVFLRSPKNKCYVIDVKTHGGTIFFDGKTLMRRYGKSTLHDFGKNHRGEAKDLIKAIKNQAIELKHNQQVSSVTSILCFTKARVSSEYSSNSPVEEVYLVKLAVLVSLLRRLDKG